MVQITIENVAFVGIGLGWLIAVICILRNFYNWSRGRYICLLSDIVRASFATITIALVINFSLVIYVDLRNAESENIRLLSDATAREGTIGALRAENESLSQANRSLSENIQNLSVELARLQDNRNFISGLREFWQDRAFRDAFGEHYKPQVTQILEQHFGESGDVYELRQLTFAFRPLGSNMYINCDWDDPFLYCGESR